jgi:hypothetical protein
MGKGFDDAVGYQTWIPQDEPVGEILGHPVRRISRLGLRGWAYGLEIQPAGGVLPLLGHILGETQLEGVKLINGGSISSEPFIKSGTSGLGHISWFTESPVINLLRNKTDDNPSFPAKLIGGYLTLSESYRISMGGDDPASGYCYQLVSNLILTTDWSDSVDPLLKNHLLQYPFDTEFFVEEGTVVLLPIVLPIPQLNKNPQVLSSMADGNLPILEDGEIRFQIRPQSMQEELKVGNGWEDFVHGQFAFSIEDLNDLPIRGIKVPEARIVPLP